MENNRLYIVSFGDSRKYRMFYNGDEAAAAHNSLLTEVEQELNDFLQNKFPEDSFRYYTTPKVTEVKWEDRDKYASYPILDKNAMADLECLLSKEIEEMNAVKIANLNAPYANAPLD